MARVGTSGGSASVPARTLAALADLQAALQQDRAETPDEGFLSVRQWAEVWELSYNQAGKWLTQAERAGKAEKREFYVKTGTLMRKIPHYRVIV